MPRSEHSKHVRITELIAGNEGSERSKCTSRLLVRKYNS